MKVIRGERELSEKDFIEFHKGLRPGEWVIIEDHSSNKNFIAYVNPHSENFYKVKIILEDKLKKYNEKLNEENVANELIAEGLKNAFQKRKIFKNYIDGARLVYGINDQLPGVIVDQYKKYILVQVNTAGMDRFRALIKSEISSVFDEHRILFFDNVEYRKAEVLPIYEPEKIEDESLLIRENDIEYKIPTKIMQKIGYYYDHRENRLRLKNILDDLNISKKNGLDLFCYVGSWGLHLLKAGVQSVEFVDQGNMQEAVTENLDLNGFKGRGEFIRSDVFKYLDEKNNIGKKFDIIVSDPPAFTKSDKNKSMALQGYEKLHLKALRILSEQGVFVAASCTHYVSHEELDKTVQDAANKAGRSLQLIDIGLQGHDHPMSSLSDKSFYIKYLVYLVN